MQQSVTPKAADSSFYFHWTIAAAFDNHDANAVFNIHDSQLGNAPDTGSQHCFNYITTWSPAQDVNRGYANMWSHGSDSVADDYKAMMIAVSGIYTPSYQNTNARNFRVVARTHRVTAANGITFNYGYQDHPHMSTGVCNWVIMEIANGAVS